MRGSRRILILLAIMAGVSLGVGAIALVSLYRASFEQQRKRLVEIAKSQASMIEAMARFDAARVAKDDAKGLLAITLNELRDAHKHFEGLGKTGEFVLAKREGDQIVFLLSHRHHDFNNPHPVPFESKIAEPVRMAVSGGSGTVVGLDYRGERVLAAYEYLKDLEVGVVAKIDMAEIRAPFIRAGLLAGAGGLVLILLGNALFLRIGNPIVQRLEENERKYRGVFESAADKLLLVGRDGAVLDVNPAACSGFGFSREEFIGQSVQKIVSPEHFALFDTASKEALEGKSFGAESVHVRKDGTRFPVEVRLSPMVHKGQPVILAVIRDITGRKQAEQVLRESREDLNRAQAVARIGSWRLNVQRNELLWSDENYRIFGIPQGTSLTYETFLSVVHPEDREYVDRKWKAALDGEPYDIEHRIVVGDDIKWVRERAELEFDKEGALLGGFGTTQDVTERKQAQDALLESKERYRRLSESLEETVNKQVAELRHAQTLAALGQMVSVVAHELRNPVHTINLGIDSLQRAVEQAGQKSEVSAIVEEIAYGSKWMNSVIDELLYYARPVTLSSSWRPIQEIVDEALLLTGHRLQNISVKLDVDETKAFVDAERMTRVFVNLISNAADAMPNGGNLKICAQKDETVAPGLLRLYVSDTGCGISEETLERIHEPFFTTKTRGVGLGIPICKKLIEAHDGTLTIKSKVNEGTTVEIVLPARAEA
ncbi:PAS domain S-box protein [Candidatus Poribacteria bacterium]|nr:PAS domain S-box protein [Candidatus Poribacteria bacterium]